MPPKNGNMDGDSMKSTWMRVALAGALAAAVLAFAGCGDHKRRGGDGNSGDKNQAAAPAFDASGDWATTMDATALGTTTFKMDSKGNLGGQLKTDSGETGSIAGTLSGTDAEYTVTFHQRAFLVSMTFNSAHSEASGTMVDADGHTHHMKLSKS